MLNVSNNKTYNIIMKTLIFVCFFFNAPLAYSDIEPLPIISGVGGDFTAIRGDGSEIRMREFKDKVVVLAFGYTNCADICPFTLGYLKKLYGVLSIEEI